MKTCIKTILASAIVLVCTTANAEKFSRAQLEEALPMINEIIQKQQTDDQIISIKNVELGEGVSFVYNAKVKKINVPSVDDKTSQKMICNQLKAQNLLSILEAVDHMQYNYYDNDDKLIKKIKVTKETCDSFIDNGIGSNGKYTPEFIQQNFIDPTLSQKDQLNKTLEPSMLQIKDAHLAEGSSYTIEYTALGKLNEVYSNADDEMLSKISDQLVKGTCSQTVVTSQLTLLDSIIYEIYAENAADGDEPLLSYVVTKEICDK